jgi:plastocyanin
LAVGAAMLLRTSPSQQNIQATPTPTQVVEATPEVTGEESGQVKEITVTGSAFKFDPSTITVKKGDKVKITFKNSGGTHDFVIDELNVKTPIIQGGAEAVVEFTADQEGSFEYYCSVGNHRAMGMKGTLVVEE